MPTTSSGDPDQRIPLQEQVAWTLRAAAAKSAGREVEVRFRGPGIEAKDEDTITLDPAPPRVTDTLLLKGNKGLWFVGLTASDDQDGSASFLRFEVRDAGSAQDRLGDRCARSSRAIAGWQTTPDG